MLDIFLRDGGAWFAVPALVGTGYFVLQLALGELGGDLDVDADVDGGDPAGEFGVLSLQTLSAFAMGSGWMGLGALRLLDIGFFGAVLVALLSGIGVAWVMVTVMRKLLRLQSSGNIPIRAVVGETGTIYVQVPGRGLGRGRVTVVVANKQREYNAVQLGDEPIASKRTVRVIEADETSNTVTVEVV